MFFYNFFITICLGAPLGLVIRGSKKGESAPHRVIRVCPGHMPMVSHRVGEVLLVLATCSAWLLATRLEHCIMGDRHILTHANNTPYFSDSSRNMANMGISRSEDELSVQS